MPNNLRLSCYLKLAFANKAVSLCFFLFFSLIKFFFSINVVITGIYNPSAELTMPRKYQLMMQMQELNKKKQKKKR